MTFYGQNGTVLTSTQGALVIDLKDIIATKPQPGSALLKPILDTPFDPSMSVRSVKINQLRLAHAYILITKR